MIDHQNPHLMFAVAVVGIDPTGCNFVKRVVKYPTNCSYTGYCIEHNKILIYNKDEKNFHAHKHKKEEETKTGKRGRE